jgi:hypothetical protein
MNFINNFYVLKNDIVLLEISLTKVFNIKQKRFPLNNIELECSDLPFSTYLFLLTVSKITGF